MSRVYEIKNKEGDKENRNLKIMLKYDLTDKDKKSWGKWLEARWKLEKVEEGNVIDDALILAIYLYIICQIVFPIYNILNKTCYFLKIKKHL